MREGHALIQKLNMGSVSQSLSLLIEARYAKNATGGYGGRMGRML